MRAGLQSRTTSARCPEPRTADGRRARHRRRPGRTVPTDGRQTDRGLPTDPVTNHPDVLPPTGDEPTEVLPPTGDEPTELLAGAAVAADSTGEFTREHRRRVSHRRCVMRRIGVSLATLAILGGGVFLLVALLGDSDDGAGGTDSTTPATSEPAVAPVTTRVTTTVAPETTDTVATQASTAAETTEADPGENPDTTTAAEATDPPEETDLQRPESTTATESSPPGTVVYDLDSEASCEIGQTLRRGDAGPVALSCRSVSTRSPSGRRSWRRRGVRRADRAGSASLPGSERAWCRRDCRSGDRRVARHLGRVIGARRARGEHEALRSVVREFAAAEIEPHAASGIAPTSSRSVRQMGELGLFGIPFQSVGGGGGDFTALCVAIEELARAISPSPSRWRPRSASVPTRSSSSAAARSSSWLPDLCAGRSLGAFGLTEPDAGSDAGGTRTRRTIDDTTGDWVVDGEKAFITNSGTPITSIITVTALTGPGEISSIVVPADTPGLVVQPAYRKMGWHASDTHGLTFVEAASRRRTCSASRGAATPSSSRSSTKVRWRSPPSLAGRDPAMCRRCRRLCRGTDGVRPSDRVEPRCRLPVRRHAGRPVRPRDS